MSMISIPRSTARAALAMLLGLGSLAAAAQAPASAPGRRGADPVLVRAMQEHRWSLQSATDGAGKAIEALAAPGVAIQLVFDGARLGVEGGCNRMNGSWRVSPQQQLLVGRLAATMKACEPPLMAADSALSKLLAQPLTPQLTPGTTPSLRLSTAGGDTLVLSGQPTPESLYGKPKRLFYEIAADTVECVSGVMRTQCLRVRELRFDDKGLKVNPPGEWQNFHGRIEGYTHTPGVRNVLRLKRYTRPNPPADGSAFLYVLDLVVESEVVKK